MASPFECDARLSAPVLKSGAPSAPQLTRRLAPPRAHARPFPLKALIAAPSESTAEFDP
jgi:hypothetical protein